MKKTLLILALITSAFLSYSETKPEEPTDTDGNGYLNISTLSHLRWLSESPNADLLADYELDNDIDASETRVWNVGDHDNNPTTPDSAMGWKPTGYYNQDSALARPFLGRLHGKGYNISGLYINRPEEDYVGFISYALNEFSIDPETGRAKIIYISDIKFSEIKISGKNYVGSIIGLFGATSKSSYNSPMSHIVVENGTVKGNSSVGGILGHSQINLRLVYFKGTVIGNEDNIGGITGYTTGNIWFSFARCSIIGSDNIGGIAGKSDSDNINLTYWSGSIGGNSNVGGIIGKNNGTDISESYWVSDANSNIASDLEQAISVSKLKSGSFSENWDFKEDWIINPIYNEGYPIFKGFMVTPEAANDSDNNGYIEITSLGNLLWLSEGGFDGLQNYELINDLDCDGSDDIYAFRKEQFVSLGGSENIFKGILDGHNYAIKGLQINGSENYNGFISKIDGATIKNLDLDIETLADNRYDGRGNRYVGGIAGHSSNSTILNCKVHIGLYDSFFGGGIVGFVDSAVNISNCHVNGFIGSSSTAGGIVGYVSNSCLIDRCSVEAAVDAFHAAGGLIGTVNKDILVTESFSTGRVEAKSGCGGIVGEDHGELSVYRNCYSRSDIFGYSWYGGFIGSGSPREITNCYATGKINIYEQGTFAGGFSGSSSKDNSASCYWDIETSGIDRSELAHPRTTAQMKTQSNYVGWEFDNIWAIDPNINDGYPYLRGLSPVFSVQEDYATEEKEILIYPNPATNKISLNTPSHNITKVLIYSLSGSLVLSSGHSQDIDVSVLNAGNYIVAAETANGKIITGKFEIK